MREARLPWRSFVASGRLKAVPVIPGEKFTWRCKRCSACGFLESYARPEFAAK